MATTPIVDTMEARSIKRDAATLRFQRLERVRARQRSRRKYRLILVTFLVVAVAVAGVVGFTAVLGSSLERLRDARPPAPVEVPTQPAAVTTGTEPAFTAASAILPHAIRPQRIQIDAPPAIRPTPRAAGPDPTAPRDGDSPSRSSNQGGSATAPSRDEPRDAEAVDPTLVIDWLLQTSRTRGR